jgi:hypothetical protein
MSERGGDVKDFKSFEISGSTGQEKSKMVWELSRASESSEQFVWLNRQYDETETQFSRLAIRPSIRADSSQDEVM